MSVLLLLPAPRMFASFHRTYISAHGTFILRLDPAVLLIDCKPLQSFLAACIVELGDLLGCTSVWNSIHRPDGGGFASSFFSVLRGVFGSPVNTFVPREGGDYFSWRYSSLVCPRACARVPVRCNTFHDGEIPPTDKEAVPVPVCRD